MNIELISQVLERLSNVIHEYETARDSSAWNKDKEEFLEKLKYIKDGVKR